MRKIAGDWSTVHGMLAYYTASEMNIIKFIHASINPLRSRGTNVWIHSWSNSYVALIYKLKRYKIMKVFYFKKDTAHILFELLNIVQRILSFVLSSVKDLHTLFIVYVHIHIWIKDGSDCLTSKSRLQNASKSTAFVQYVSENMHSYFLIT